MNSDLRSSVELTQLCARGTFGALYIQFFDPNSYRKQSFQPVTDLPQLRPQIGHKHDTKPVSNKAQNQLQNNPEELDKKISFFFLPFGAREHHTNSP